VTPTFEFESDIAFVIVFLLGVFTANGLCHQAGVELSRFSSTLFLRLRASWSSCEHDRSAVSITVSKRVD